METLILNQAFQPVEGLIVDTVNGGIGFRNHTFPPGFQHGVTWTEDLLFIEPETVCVDTNLTLNFTIASTPNATTIITDLVLTDRGGFANLHHTIPEFNISDPQRNPDIFGRTYTAAWQNKFYTTLYYNITDESQKFAYLDSFIGKTFPLQNPSGSGGFDSLVITLTYGDYLNLETVGTVGNFSTSADSGLPTNPFNLTFLNFTGIECSLAGSDDLANITNIFITCGLIHGVPQRQDAGSRLVFDTGGSWSQPLYSCASAVKATIKTVSFNYNGTDGSFQSLAISNLQEKVYPDHSTMPLWSVKNYGNRYDLGEINPIWGLVSSTYENNENVSTVRQSSLYLPSFGWLSYGGAINLDTLTDNLPGSEFFSSAMATAYSVLPGSSEFFVDYSDTTNMAMWAKWQNLSLSTETVSLIPNLIWTDNAASTVVGMKGVLGPGNTAHENIAQLQVTPTVSTIKIHYLFTIPALLAASGFVLIMLAVFVTMISKRGGIARMRLHFQQLSPGRIFTTFIYREEDGMAIRAKDWSKHMGQRMVDLSGQFPTAADGMLLPPEKGPRVTGKGDWKREQRGDEESQQGTESAISWGETMVLRITGWSGSRHVCR